MQKEEFTGEKLKFLRKKHGLKQKEIAEAIGAEPPRISEWENEKYNKISNSYQRLLKLFFDNLEKKQ